MVVGSILPKNRLIPCYVACFCDEIWLPFTNYNDILKFFAELSLRDFLKVGLSPSKKYFFYLLQ